MKKKLTLGTIIYAGKHVFTQDDDGTIRLDNAQAVIDLLRHYFLKDRSLKEIRLRVDKKVILDVVEEDLNEEFNVWLLEQLEDNGIEVIPWDEFDGTQKKYGVTLEKDFPEAMDILAIRQDPSAQKT